MYSGTLLNFSSKCGWLLWKPSQTKQIDHGEVLPPAVELWRNQKVNISVGIDHSKMLIASHGYLPTPCNFFTMSLKNMSFHLLLITIQSSVSNFTFNGLHHYFYVPGRVRLFWAPGYDNEIYCVLAFYNVSFWFNASGIDPIIMVGCLYFWLVFI